jgi:tRNA threonylcarbamoyladenosine biosynthesis protein TsaB
MWILGFETAGRRGGVGLGQNGTVQATSYLEGRGVFARHLVELAAQLLREHQLGAADLAAVAVAIGPGSLTGLRIGLASAGALAYAAKRPTVPVGNLEALAFKHRRDGPSIAAWLEAGPDRIYHALYSSSSGDVSETLPPAAGTPETALDQLAGPVVLVLGGGTSRFLERVLARRPQAVIQTDDLNLVETVVELGFARLGQGRICPPDRLRALYLRDPQMGRPD